MARNTFSHVRLLVVDLDNTLCDTFHTLSKVQWQKAMAVLKNDGVDRTTIVRFRKQLGRKSFRSTINGLDERRQRLALRAYDNVDLRPLRLYADAAALLSLPFPKVLVTRGERRLQRAKIRRLGIRRHFRRVYHVDTFGQKKDAFRDVLRDFRVTPRQVLVIGDRIEEEIRDAKALGMPTVFIDRPDWPSHPRFAKPDLTLRDLRRLGGHLPTPRRRPAGR